jgi:hypothetical protein
MSSPSKDDAMSPSEEAKSESSDAVHERLQGQQKDNSDDNSEAMRTTSFSVADILDPRKFTGCSTPEKSRVWTPWKDRKRRLTDSTESTSDEDRREGTGTLCIQIIDNGMDTILKSKTHHFNQFTCQIIHL